MECHNVACRCSRAGGLVVNSALAADYVDLSDVVDWFLGRTLVFNLLLRWRKQVEEYVLDLVEKSGGFPACAALPLCYPTMVPGQGRGRSWQLIMCCPTSSFYAKPPTPFKSGTR